MSISDIVVTARRTTERAQDVPISLSVASGEMLVNRSVQTFIDVQRQTPSLHIVPAAISATATNLSMRGQVLVDIRLNIDPAVAIYVDGVYLPRAQGSNAADLIDIDRVEVLAGPQGTLYGKNTTGGAVSIYAKEPTDRVEGMIKGRIGTYMDSNIAGVINVPLGEGMAFRGVGSFSHRDGYGRNRLNGDRNGKLNSGYGRGALKLEPTDRLTVMLRGDYTHAKVSREAFKGMSFLQPVDTDTGAAPTATLAAALEMNNLTAATFAAQPLATRISQLLAADGALRAYSAGDPDDNFADQDSRENIKIWGFSGQIDYELSDGLSFKSITAWRGFNRRATADLDGTPFQILYYPFQQTKDHQFSQEAQLNIRALDGRLNMVTGIYYADEDGTERVFQGSVARILGANAISHTVSYVQNRSFGVFGQGTFKFSDYFSATAGVRYSKDKRQLTAQNYNSVDCTSLGVSLASIGGVDNCLRPMEAKFDRVNYLGSLEYRPTRDVMIYVKTSRGYRAGGLQAAVSGATPAAADAAFAPFSPETVTDYEVGLKSEWFDRRLRVNISYYHSILKNAIRNVSTPVPNEPRSVTRAQNAASAKIDGIEFDVTALPARGLELSVNGSWTDGRFTRYITPTGENRSALPLLFTPKWQLGAAAAYTADLGFAEWRNQVDVSYTSRQLAAEVVAYSPAHTIWNARSSIDIASADMNVAVYVKNFTNRRYIMFPVDIGALGFTYAGLYNPPRTAGVELTKRF